MENHYEKQVQTELVNISTNINKTTNHLAPQIIDTKNTTAYEVVNQVLGLGEVHLYSIINYKKEIGMKKKIVGL